MVYRDIPLRHAEQGNLKPCYQYDRSGREEKSTEIHELLPHFLYGKTLTGFRPETRDTPAEDGRLDRLEIHSYNQTAHRNLRAETRIFLSS